MVLNVCDSFNIALDNYFSTLMKVRTQQVEITKHPLLLPTVVLLRVIQFLTTIPLLGGGMPPIGMHRQAPITNLKSNQDGYIVGC